MSFCSATQATSVAQFDSLQSSDLTTNAESRFSFLEEVQLLAVYKIYDFRKKIKQDKKRC